MSGLQCPYCRSTGPFHEYKNGNLVRMRGVVITVRVCLEYLVVNTSVINLN
jgi:hypothetical protein